MGSSSLFIITILVAGHIALGVRETAAVEVRVAMTTNYNKDAPHQLLSSPCPGSPTQSRKSYIALPVKLYDMFKALSQTHTINLAYLLNPQLSYVFKSFGVACGSKYIVKLGLEVPTLTQWPRGIHNKGRGTLVYKNKHCSCIQ